MVNHSQVLSLSSSVSHCTSKCVLPWLFQGGTVKEWVPTRFSEQVFTWDNLRYKWSKHKSYMILSEMHLPDHMRWWLVFLIMYLVEATGKWLVSLGWRNGSPQGAQNKCTWDSLFAWLKALTSHILENVHRSDSPSEAIQTVVHP